VSFLLDTVVLSELRKAKPSRKVVQWIKAQKADSLFVSVVSIGEIERGIQRARKSDAVFAAELEQWLETLLSLYADRILPVSANAARLWGRLSAKLGHDGADLLIAATALSHGSTVVTRNVKHFAPTGVHVFNPFDDVKQMRVTGR
jgi:toxin FitB